MQWKKWLEQWDMTALKIKAPFLEMDWAPQDEDKEAAWELYIEMLTRITTQALPCKQGYEQTALKSIYSLFATTREIMKRNGRYCTEFTKIAVVVLNQIIRPFTAKWHKISGEEGFEADTTCDEFRSDLAGLQVELKKYSRMMADMAGVEDLTELEEA